MRDGKLELSHLCLSALLSKTASSAKLQSHFVNCVEKTDLTVGVSSGVGLMKKSVRTGVKLSLFRSSLSVCPTPGQPAQSLLASLDRWETSGEPGALSCLMLHALCLPGP
jgi:hypothetical protein